jgi:peroxiredoxin
MPNVNRWQRDYDSVLTVVVISEGTVRDNQAKSAEHAVTQILLQKEREVADAYQAYGTPGAVLIQKDGTIGSPLATGAEAIQALVSRIPGMIKVPPALPQNIQLDTPDRMMKHASSVQVGQLAPSLNLHGLNGKTINLSSFRVSETLLLFWNPDCGFCQGMLRDLRELDANPPRGAPKLLILSTGTVENNLAMNLRSQIVLDPDSQAASAFGAGGTPMAVLLDAEGRVASEVAAGAQAVLALAGAGAKSNMAAMTQPQ